VSVNGNWRLTFSFEGQDAILIDYQELPTKLYVKEVFMEMHNPPHPGRVLKNSVLARRWRDFGHGVCREVWG